MAFREKLAWITLGSMVIAYGLYFSQVAAGAKPGLAMLAMFGIITIAQVIVIAVATALVAALSPSEAHAPADERDRAIARRGASVAYFALMSLMIPVGVVMPFSEPGWAITNAALAALVAAEFCRHAIVLLSYRRGWHG